MRIIINTALNDGAAEYSNMGDVAMLQVAVRRLRNVLPSASIQVLTDSPAHLKRFCPTAEPLPRSGRDLWVADHAIFGRLGTLLPKRGAAGLRKLTRALRLRLPTVFHFLIKLKLAVRNQRSFREGAARFVDALRHADILVVCGAGGFSDHTKSWDLLTLDTIEEAAQRRVPVVMLGQSMGPLTDSQVLARARRILPQVCLLTLRGSRGGMHLAQSLGLRRSQLMTTGDEAIEFAYESRVEELGEGIGVNLRVATYSNVGREMAARLKPILHTFARQRSAPLLPLPIAFHAWANDQLISEQLLDGFDEHANAESPLNTPLQIIKQVSRCRIVMTGAYHGAVFALSQGIPVVALTASEDYTTKFQGLRDQFGTGCEVVRLDDANLCLKLEAALRCAWETAEEVRRPLLEAARRQIALSREASERVRDLLTSGKMRKNLVPQKVPTAS